MNSPDSILQVSSIAKAELQPDPKLIRATLLMLLLTTTAFNGEIWYEVQELPAEMHAVPLAIPAVLFVIVSIIVARMYVTVGNQGKRRTAIDAAQHQPYGSAVYADVYDDRATTQTELQTGVQDLRAGLKLLVAVPVLEGSEKHEVERLLINSLAALDRDA